MKPEYRFIWRGTKYTFPTEKQAKAEAFRLTGKIGGVEVYCVHLEPEKTKWDRRVGVAINTIVCLILLGMVMMIVGGLWLFKVLAGTGLLLGALWAVLWVVEWVETLWLSRKQKKE